ncbi:D-lyxose/D-mannose family sugar isomerase [Alteribacter aurantiacus]|uniref:D-lyxose/D-mannose family sugar isomerase n=1 Tax=Alteribacter aurantiacus TaxID=254410 RepID=UPI0004000085|nr:D-lyxose/D-mannose family sugar isomerase [Alteribacter aurantiacus]
MKWTNVVETQEKAYGLLKQAGIVLTEDEKKSIEIAEFGFNEFDKQGLSLITYINNEKYCAKELVLFPKQTCPEHRHPPLGSSPGKMETFRCRWGEVWLYVEGEPDDNIECVVPAGSEDYYTVFHEIKLSPGEQYTIPPNTLHWFQGGEKGAIVSEFSSTSKDEHDIFTDTRIKRIPDEEVE